MAVSRPLSKRKLLPEAHGYSASPKDGESISGPSVPPPPEAKQSKPSTTDGGHSSSSCPPTPPRAEPPTPPRNKTKAKAFSTATSCTTSAAGSSCSASFGASSASGAVPTTAASEPARQLDAIAAACTPPARVDRLSGPQLEPPLLRALVDLVRRNMRDYTSKDDSKEKRAELCHPDTRVVAVRSGSQLLGFSSFRLNEDEQGVKVCYLYELQLEPIARGMRLGSTLVDEVEAEAKRAGSLGLMLTVHTRNTSARKFYQSSHMGFEVSPLSPAECAPPSVAQSCEYEILQKIWDAGARKTLGKKGAQAKRFNYLQAIDQGELSIKVVMKCSRAASPTEDVEGVNTQKSKASEADAPPTPKRRARR